jgi:glycosyltransferase involved in cell wall biosynthesis
MYPSLRHKVISIHNLLNTDLINQNSNYSINDKLFLNDRFTIISVGRVDPVKRFECIPNIASNLEARGCRFRWFIIGPEYGDKTFMSLKYEIEKYNVENCVIYLGAKKNPYPYFKNADLLVSLSSTEACPMIFNEAKILTLPIVTTDFGSSFEFIKNGESGVIVAFQDMIDTLFSIISNPEYYKSLKQNMSKLKYSNETILSQLRELFS